MKGLEPETGIVPSGEFSGWYQVSGTVYELGVVDAYRVRLFTKREGRLLKQVWSDANGAYRLTRLLNDAGAYFATAEDYGAYQINAGISDQLILEPMP